MRARVVQLVAVGVALIAGAGLAGPTQHPAEAASRPAVKGLEWRDGVSVKDSTYVKSVAAECPYGKRALGGSVQVNARDQVVLTKMEPYLDGSGYVATAAETYKGMPEAWSINLRVSCAEPLPGYHIVGGSTAWSSDPTKETLARCSAGQSVLGTGATITPGYTLEQGGRLEFHHQGLGLQMMRASGPGDITRARAAEAPQGYAYAWKLESFAICADTPKFYQVAYGDVSDQHGSESFKVSGNSCPKYTEYVGYNIPVSRQSRPVGMGIAIDNGVPGNVTVQSMRLNSADGVVVAAVENTPTTANWGSISAQAICVNH